MSLDSEELKVRIDKILTIGTNGVCADCDDTDVQWCSLNLGVLLCTICSGIHRNLGVHISRVRSLFLDNWKEEEVQQLEKMGNSLANQYYEGNTNLSKNDSDNNFNFIKPTKKDSVTFREQFSRLKYENKLFAEDSSWILPISQQGYLTKRGARRKSWKKRWFVLIGSMLFYYKKEISKQGSVMYPISYISLSKCNLNLLPDSTKEDVVSGVPGGVSTNQQSNNIENSSEAGIHSPSSTIDSSKYCFCINISTSNREWYLNADSALQMFEWIQALRYAFLTLLLEKSQINSQDLIETDVLEKFSKGVLISNYKTGSKKHNNCFTGNHGIDFVVKNYKLSRKKSVKFLTNLCQKNLIVCISHQQENQFKDEGNFLYQCVN